MLRGSNIEIQRVLKVVEQLREELGIFALLTPQVIEALDTAAGQSAVSKLGSDLAAKLKEENELLEIYVAANTAKDGTFKRSSTDDDQLLKLNYDSALAMTQEINRSLKSLPGALNELKAIQESKPVQFLQFIKAVGDLRDVTEKRLSTSVEEDKTRAELISLTISSEHKAKLRREALEVQLIELRRLKHDEHDERVMTITKLRTQLDEETDSFKSQLGAIRSTLETNLQKMAESFTSQETQLKAEIESSSEHLKKLREACAAEEDGLRRQKNRRVVEIENIVKRYDTEMNRLTQAYETQLRDSQAENRELEKLKDHFRLVDANLERIAEEQALEQARLSKESKEKEKLDALSTAIQAFWRGALQREEFAKLRKAAKKKGGKKAKSKKGKENKK